MREGGERGSEVGIEVGIGTVFTMRKGFLLTCDLLVRAFFFLLIFWFSVFVGRVLLIFFILKCSFWMPMRMPMHYSLGLVSPCLALSVLVCPSSIPSIHIPTKSSCFNLSIQCLFENAPSYGHFYL